MKPRPTPKLEWFNDAIKRLEKSIDMPVLVHFEDDARYRFKERNVENAVFLKCVRYISALNAGNILIENGFVQELGSIKRMLDETYEDILFLTLPKQTDCDKNQLEKFLSAFWEEEPSFSEFLSRQKNRDMRPRTKIRSSLSRSINNGKPDEKEMATSKYLSRMYSGFIHGAAPHIMDLFNPDIRGFCVDGIEDRLLHQQHQSDFENYFFRGITLIYFTAHLLRKEELMEEAKNLQFYFEQYYSD